MKMRKEGDIPSRRFSKSAALNAAVSYAMEALETRRFLSASISGTVYNDANGNHARDAGEAAVAGQQVYLDLQGINMLVAGDPIAMTDATGAYSFTGLAAGNYLVRPVPVAGKVTTTPIWGGKFFVQLGANQNVTGEDFGIQTAATPNFTVNGQLLIAGTANGQATLTRYNTVDGSTDVTFGSLGVVTLPASVTGQPTGAVAQGANTVVTYPTQTVTLDSTGGVVSITPTGGTTINAPTNVTAVATSATTVNISFMDNATNETFYRIERATSVNGPFGLVAIVTGTSSTGPLSGTDLAAQPNTTYFYRVFGSDGTVNSAYGGPVTVTTPALNSGGATISGTLTGSDGFEQIYLDLQGIDQYVAGDPIVTPDAAGHYQFTGLPAGNYLVRVVPRDGFFTTSPLFGGKQYVQLGANQTASGEDFTVQFFQTFTVSGQFLVAGASSNGLRTLTRYNADHTTDINYGTLGTVTLPSTVTGDPTAAALQPGGPGNTVVTYPSAIVTLSPSGAILSIAPIGQGINAPTGLTASATSPTSVQLGFTDNSTNDNGFVIERSTSAAGPFVNVGSLPGTVTGPSTGFVGFADNTASPNTTYFYRVYAVNGATQSTPAGPVSVTTPAQTAGGSISGTVFNDQNFDGIANFLDTPVAGRQVYLDLNGIGVFASGDPVSTTDANGHYSFTGLPSANYLVRLIPQANTVISAPIFGGKYFVQLANNQAVTGDNFGTHDITGEVQRTQTDSKVLVGDIFPGSLGANLNASLTLRRFNPDGSLDVTYGQLGSITLISVQFPTQLGVSFIGLGPDGSALVGTSRVGGQLQSDDEQLFLVSPTGQLVNSNIFTGGDSETDSSKLTSAIFLPNGQILGIGATQMGSGSRLILAKYSSNLTVLPTNTGGLIFGNPTNVTGLPDGSIQLGFSNDLLTLSPTLALDPSRVLATPTGFTATALSPTSVQLQFNDNSTNEQSFVITRTTDVFHSGPVIATLPGTTGTGIRTFTDTSLLAGKSYTYDVYAVNGAVRSFDAGLVTVLTPTS